MSLHPEGKNALHPKRHFIYYVTTSPNALRPEWHFILSALHLKGHFISGCTSSHNGTSSHYGTTSPILVPSHFIHSSLHFFWVTSYQREKWSLHTGHFIPVHYIPCGTSYESLHTALSILETYIGNIVVWKHHLHLETKNVFWKHTLDIGNIIWILETYELDWKHNLDIGNITFVWKHTNFGKI